MFKKIIHKWSWTALIAFCIVGIFIPSIGIIALACMLAPVLVSFFKGRFWCGNFCPRGSFNDILLSKISSKRNIPKLFKKLWFKITFLIVLMSMFAIQIYMSWGNLHSVGLVFVRMIFITTIVTIILGTIYHQRSWCAICPMGTLAGFIATSKSKQKKVVQNTCSSCKTCNKNCKININSV